MAAGEKGKARCLVAVFLLAFPVVALGQQPAGVIEGRVVDETGAPIAGVTVTATGTQPGQDFSTSTDARGQYRLDGLSAGLYLVTVQVSGFVTEELPGIALITGGNVPLEIRMRVLTLEELMDIPVVTATKTAQRVVETPAIVTVITAEEIRERGYETVAEALRAVPGLSVWEDNLISSVSIRGINSVRGWSQTLKVMIDGQPVAFRTGSTHFIDAEMLPIRAVQRIEIIQGPGSALYGANAFLGVVNVITRDFPAQRARPELSFGLSGGGKLVSDRGDSRSAGADLLLARRLGEVGLLAAAAYQYADRSGLRLPQPVPVPLKALGASQGDLARPASFLGKLGYRGFSLEGNYQRFDRYGEFTDFSVLTHQNRISVANWYVRGDYRRPFGVKTEARLFAAYSEGEPTADDHLDVGSPRFWIRRELGVKSVDTGAEVHLRAREDLRFVGGLDYTTDDQQLQNNILVFKDGSGERYQTPSTILGKKRFNNLGVFLQGVSGLGDKLEVTAGGRLDSHNIYGEDFNWRLAAVYGPASTVHVKLLAATSFKAPTPRELYDVSGTSRGNPDLRPQKARTFEAAVEALSGSFGGSLNVFHNHLTDIIKLVTPAKAEPGVQKSYANIATINSYGVGAEVRYARGEFRGFANVAYQHSKDEETGLRTTLVPEVTANLGLGCGLWRRLVVDFETSLVGARVSPKPAALAYDPSLADRAGFEVDRYALSSLTLSTRGLKLFGRRETLLTLGVRNLFDVEYVDPGYENRGVDVPHAGRTAYVRVVQRF